MEQQLERKREQAMEQDAKHWRNADATLWCPHCHSDAGMSYSDDRVGGVPRAASFYECPNCRQMFIAVAWLRMQLRQSVGFVVWCYRPNAAKTRRLFDAIDNRQFSPSDHDVIDCIDNHYANG